MENLQNNIENEIWKQIDEFPNYMVSNKGRVKSLKYGKERILRPAACSKYKHKFVALFKNNIRTYKLVHRLVAEAFLTNPENLPCIDHIDTNASNNSVENLRWCSQQDNCNNPLTKLHIRDAQGGQPIYCFETKTTYVSANEAARQLNVHSGNISSCCKGKVNHTGGYHFCYSDNMPDMMPLLKQK